MLKLCKFYRYLIYRIYHFSNDTPGLNVILTLSVIHSAQILVIYMSIRRIFFDDCLPSILFSKYEDVIYVIFLFLLNYFLFYNKKKWKSYFKEFQNETEKERKRGFILVLSYLIGSIVASFGLAILVNELFPAR